VAVHVVRTEGPRGLYRGFVSNASRNTPGEMVFFATYEQARHFIKQSGQVKDDIGLSCLLTSVGSFVLLNVAYKPPTTFFRYFVVNKFPVNIILKSQNHWIISSWKWETRSL